MRADIRLLFFSSSVFIHATFSLNSFRVMFVFSNQKGRLERYQTTIVFQDQPFQSRVALIIFITTFSAARSSQQAPRYTLCFFAVGFLAWESGIFHVPLTIRFSGSFFPVFTQIPSTTPRFLPRYPPSPLIYALTP